MESLNKLQGLIRDSFCTEITLQYENKENDNRIRLEIKFRKDEKTIMLTLHNPKIIDIFDNSPESNCISHLKWIKENEKSYWLVLDPLDENINEIEEADNYKVNYESHSIKY